jgi:hypothetical protein
MSNQLFKDAIADAKQIREAALVNAKKALEEAFTPRIQSMISSKLNEMDEYEELEENYDNDDMEEGFKTSHGGWDKKDDSLTLENEELEEDFNIDEILAEMEMEEDNYEELEEGKKKEDKKEKKEKKEDDEEMESEDEEMETESEEVGDMTVSELKDLIKSIVTQEIEHEEMETPEEEAGEHGEMGMEMGMGDDEEVNLAEILDEIDGIYDDSELEEGKIAKWVSGKKAPAISSKLGFKPVGKKSMKEGREMNEAIKTINILRTELNEVNLLNAKLLYVNKIFKSKNLNESQKIKVITAFDKATTTKEAKMVFESLSSTLETKITKQPIKESLGFASKAAGVAPRKNTIIETNDVVSRMQKLANIK